MMPKHFSNNHLVEYCDIRWWYCTLIL
jgi:hypothetical protein